MKLKIAVAAIAAVVGLSGAKTADAAVVLTMLEVGSDVIVTGGGTVNTDGFSIGLNALTFGGAIDPSIASITLGAGGSAIFLPGAISGPASLGPGMLVFASSESGDVFGIDLSRPGLFLPASYVSGAPLSTTATFASQTLTTIGVTPGTYVWSWGTGPDLDTLTLLIGPDAAAARVPAPATALLLGLGVVAAAVGRARRSA